MNTTTITPIAHINRTTEQAISSGLEVWNRTITAHRQESRVVVRDSRGRFVKVTRPVATAR